MNLLEVLGKRPIGCTGWIGLELVVVTYRDWPRVQPYGSILRLRQIYLRAASNATPQ